MRGAVMDCCPSVGGESGPVELVDVEADWIGRELLLRVGDVQERGKLPRQIAVPVGLPWSSQVVSVQSDLVRLPGDGDDDVDLNGHAHARFDQVERVVVLDEGVELVSAVLRDELVGVGFTPVAFHDSDVGGDLARVADEAAEVVLNDAGGG